MKKKALVLLVGLLATAAVFAGCGVSETTQTATETGTAQTEQKEKKEDLEVLEHSVVQDGYFSYVVGKIKNNTNKTYSYVQVSINLYKGESQAGSTLANVNNLEPGGTWEFKAMVTNDDFTSYKIVDVTGFQITYKLK